VWSLIHEVPDGDWAAAGHTVRYAQLTQVAATERAGSLA
jgi:phenylpyruvate tautomerase PptA (4-oxalocrotonate tautomerase family)